MKRFMIFAVFIGVLGFVLNTPIYAEEGHEHGQEEESHEGEPHQDEHGHEEEGVVKLNADQIKAAGITVTKIGQGGLAKEVSVPGRIITAADRMAKVVPRVGGIVIEAKKNLGDAVEKGEILALIESREVAEAIAEHQAAKESKELTNTIYLREKEYWEKRVIPQKNYLDAQNDLQEANINLNLTKQKLQALGHDGDANNTRFDRLKSPLAGRIIARELTLGEYVDGTHEAFTVADLSVLWVEIAVAPNDLPFVSEGQAVAISAGVKKAEGKLIFLSPAIDPETRTAKAIVELDNAKGEWRPGEFANAAIATASHEASITIPKDAVQNIEGQNVVFVQTAEGFEKRLVSLGREDSRNAEIISGLKAGESIAASGTFTLKAELGKSEAEHSH